MKKIKILFSILGLLIIICVLAMAGLVYFIDPNDMKPVIIEEIKKQTGYEIAIDGKLTWSFYPRIAVKVDHLILKTPNKKSPFLDAVDVRFATEITELFHSNKNLQGKILISKMHFMNMKVDDVNANLYWENNGLTLNPIQATLYQGKLEGIIKAQNLSTQPHWQWEMQVSNIQVKPLLQDVNGNDSKIKISGVGKFTLQAEANGKSREQMLHALNGKGEFSLNNGVVEGIDLNYLFQSAEALLNREQVTLPSEDIKQTVFNSITGSMIIRNGVTETDNMLLSSADFTTYAKGYVELITRAINFHLQIRPKQEVKLQWRIPVVITGYLDEPNVRLDTMEIQQFLAGKEIEKAKQKAIEQIKKHVPGKTGEFLQKLLR